MSNVNLYLNVTFSARKTVWKKAKITENEEEDSKLKIQVWSLDNYSYVDLNCNPSTTTLVIELLSSMTGRSYASYANPSSSWWHSYIQRQWRREKTEALCSEACSPWQQHIGTRVRASTCKNCWMTVRLHPPMTWQRPAEQMENSSMQTGTLESSRYAWRKQQQELNIHDYQPWTGVTWNLTFCCVLNLYKAKTELMDWPLLDDAASRMSVKMASKMRL